VPNTFGQHLEHFPSVKLLRPALQNHFKVSNIFGLHCEQWRRTWRRASLGAAPFIEWCSAPVF